MLKHLPKCFAKRVSEQIGPKQPQTAEVFSMPLPFDASFEAIEGNLDAYVDSVFDGLRSEFMTMPKGPGFIEYPVFEEGYEALKRATRDFRKLDPGVVLR